jgi:hypothetical protein
MASGSKLWQLLTSGYPSRAGSTSSGTANHASSSSTTQTAYTPTGLQVTITSGTTAKVFGSSRDFNADGKSVILWRHASGYTTIWLLNGAGIAEPPPWAASTPAGQPSDVTPSPPSACPGRWPSTRPPNRCRAAGARPSTPVARHVKTRKSRPARRAAPVRPAAHLSGQAAAVSVPLRRLLSSSGCGLSRGRHPSGRVAMASSSNWHARFFGMSGIPRFSTFVDAISTASTPSGTAAVAWAAMTLTARL